MHVLITGGAGFIGSALSERLLADDHRVTIADVAPEHYRGDSTHPRINIAPRDCGDVEALRPLAWEADQIVHLASRVGVHHYIDSPRATVDTILRGTEAVLTLAREFDIPLVIASTSEAYGKGVRIPMGEGDDIRFGAAETTRWVYGMAKALADQLALADHRQHGTDVRIFRPFNVVGPMQDPSSGLVFAQFARQVASRQPITVHGDGSQTRTFCHVDDLVDGIVRIMHTPETSGEIVNLGSDEEWTIAEIAEEFARIAHARSGLIVPIETVPYTVAYPEAFEDAMRRVPDLSRARDLIDWEPDDLVPVDEIIEQTIAHALAPVSIAAD